MPTSCRSFAEPRSSARGELEIADVKEVSLPHGTLRVIAHDRGIAWLDSGTPEALRQPANYVAALEERKGLKVDAVEEVAYRLGFIDAARVQRLVAAMKGNPYAQCLHAIRDDHS